MKSENFTHPLSANQTKTPDEDSLHKPWGKKSGKQTQITKTIPLPRWPSSLPKMPRCSFKKGLNWDKPPKGASNSHYVFYTKKRGRTSQTGRGALPKGNKVGRTTRGGANAWGGRGKVRGRNLPRGRLRSSAWHQPDDAAPRTLPESLAPLLAWFTDEECTTNAQLNKHTCLCNLYSPGKML